MKIKIPTSIITYETVEVEVGDEITHPNYPQQPARVIAVIDEAIICQYNGYLARQILSGKDIVDLKYKITKLNQKGK